MSDKMPQIDEDEWVKDFVEKLKVNRPPDKSDEELEKFARDMFKMAQERGRAMGKIDTDQ